MEQVLLGKVVINGREEAVRKGCERVNIVKILCIHVCKWKNDTCLNYSRNRGRRNKGEW
jgi:hypothetical protein